MTPERAEQIYEALNRLVVVLDADPTSKGPKYLQEQISKTRGFLNETSVYLTEILRERHRLDMELEALEAAFQISSDDLMANDRRVTILPAIQDRQSMVNVILAADRRAILAKNRELKNLGHVEKVVRHRSKELEGTMSAIRLQRSLVESELRTGASYGDESDESRGSLWRKPGDATPAAAYEDIDAAELDRLMNAEEVLVSSPSEEETPSEEASEEVEAPAQAAPAQAAPAQVEATPPSPSTDEENLEALLNLAMDEDAPADEPQAVVALTPPKPNGLSSARVEDDDKGISDFLNNEEETDDIFAGL